MVKAPSPGTPLPVATHSCTHLKNQSQTSKHRHQSPHISSHPLPSPPHPPVALLVVGQQFVNDALHPYEPARHSAVDERGLRAPTEGVAVLNLALVDKTALLLQMFHDVLICILGRGGVGVEGRGGEGRVAWEGEVDIGCGEGCMHIRTYILHASAHSQFHLHNTTQHNTTQHNTIEAASICCVLHRG